MYFQQDSNSNTFPLTKYKYLHLVYIYVAINPDGWKDLFTSLDKDDAGCYCI